MWRRQCWLCDMFPTATACQLRRGASRLQVAETPAPEAETAAPQDLPLSPSKNRRPVQGAERTSGCSVGRVQCAVRLAAPKRSMVLTKFAVRGSEGRAYSPQVRTIRCFGDSRRPVRLRVSFRVDALRLAGVVFSPRPRRRPARRAENVVGADLHQRTTEWVARATQVLHRRRRSRPGTSPAGSRFMTPGIRRAVDDRLGVECRAFARWSRGRRSDRACRCPAASRRGRVAGTVLRPTARRLR